VFPSQGDQIGRIFALWTIIYFGHFLSYRSSPHFWATLFCGLRSAPNMTENDLGYILGDFFSQTHLHLVALFLALKWVYLSSAFPP
jgi:hypothetical protein